MNKKTMIGKTSWKQRWLGIGIVALLGVVAIAATQWGQAQASSSWLTAAEKQYPTIVGTTLDSCTLCHTSAPALNPYGNDFMMNNHSFTAIENLDSDTDGYSNLVEINAHTFPGDRNSKPAAPPTATPTRVPPTATWTSTRVPPSATPTNTPMRATATSTATRVPPTSTPVNPPPPPPPTSTRPAPSPTSTRITSTGTRVPPATHPIVFRDVIRQLPGTQTLIGDWQVGNRIVHVTSQTKISREDGAVTVGALATVQGTALQDGSVNATLVNVHEVDKKANEEDNGKRFLDWLRGVGRHFGWSK